MDIVFRGKRKDNGEWIEGTLRCPKVNGFETCTINGVEVDCNTTCQWLFYNDKNGKRIFSGDIVKFIDNLVYKCNGIGRVIPENFVSLIEGRYIDGEFKDCTVRTYINIKSLELEVIGNVFDNADILEKYSI